MRAVRWLEWFAIGVLVAAVFYWLAYAERVGTTPPMVVYTFTGPQGDRIDLYSQSNEPCKALSDRALRALYTYHDGDSLHKPGQTVEGCYVIDESFVYLIYADGDRGKLQLRLFRPAA